ncbi:MAG: hypothetical protein WA821_06125 [Anaerolineales bacterium]
MSTHRISASLSPDDQEAILAAIATIKQRMPFLIDLTLKERRALPKLGDKSYAFVSKAVEMAAQNPGFLPRAFDVDEARRDMQLFEAMQPIALALMQLYELVDDTRLAVGSEAYMAALTIYNYARTGGQDQALDTLAAELGHRFAHKAPAAAPAPAAPDAPATPAAPLPEA